MSEDLTACEQELETLQEDHTRLVEENDRLRNISIFFGRLAERLNAALRVERPNVPPEWRRNPAPVPALVRVRQDRRASDG